MVQLPASDPWWLDVFGCTEYAFNPGERHRPRRRPYSHSGYRHGNRQRPVKYWEVIADNLSKAGWSWGCVSAVDSKGRTIWIVDAHRDDGKRFVVHADEKLSAVSGTGIGDARLQHVALTSRRDFSHTRRCLETGVRAGSFSPGAFFPFFRHALRRVNRREQGRKGNQT